MRKLPVDGIGLGLLIVWVGALQILLDKGKDADWFASSFIVVLAIVALVGFIVFLIWELGEEHPIIDLRSEEHTSELQSLMRRSYAVFCLKKKIIMLYYLLELHIPSSSILDSYRN